MISSPDAAPGRVVSPFKIYRAAETAAVLAGLAAIILGTGAADSAGQEICLAAAAAVTVLFVCDYAAMLCLPRIRRLMRPSAGPWWKWALSPGGVLDLATFLPVLLAIPLFGWTPFGAPLFGALWILRLGRYSRSTTLLARVLLQERHPLAGVLVLSAIVLMLGATLALALERHAQPDHFDSLPHALWWAITTLTTTGYGDLVPVTPLGRVLGGTMMMSGIILFGLFAGVLASGFSAEIRRQDFLRNWDIVASVPMFQKLGAGAISEVAGLLRHIEMPPGAIIVRAGAPGTSMYFIISGAVEVELPAGPVRLGHGDFFGEMALLTGAKRNATIRTIMETTLLELDIADLRRLEATRPELTELIRTEADLRRAARRDPAD